MYNTTSTQARSPDRSATSPIQHNAVGGYHTQVSPLRPTYHVPKPQPSSPSNAALTIMNGNEYLSRERPPSTFYDPTMDAGDRRQSARASSHSVAPQSAVPGSISTNSYRDHRSYNNPQASPVASYRSTTYPTSSPLHPPQRLYHRDHDENHSTTSPARDGQHGQAMRASTLDGQAAASPSLPTSRAANPMSFSNILSQSESNPLKSPPSQGQSVHNMEASVQVIEHQPEAVAASSTGGQSDSQATIQPPAPYSHEMNGISSAAAVLENLKSTPADLAILENAATSTSWPGSQTQIPIQLSIPATAKSVVAEKEYQAVIKEIEALYKSPLNQLGHKSAWEEYKVRGLKRVRDLDDGEQMRRKLRRIAQVTKYSSMFTAQSSLAKERYRSKYEQDAWREVQNKEIAEEKERKKIMQRNRRRENTKQRAEKEAAENREKALRATDALEKEKLLREAERAEKKAITTQKLLKGDVASDARDSSPPPPASVDGGVMGSFQVVEEAPQEPPSKKLRVGNRLKKSKEQKQAEKDAAAAAYAASERGEELPTLAPKIEAKPRAPSKKDKEAAAAKEAKSAATAAAAYNQLYESIWKDIARVKIPKLQKMKDTTLLIKQANVRKTAQLAATQARKWQIKTTKSTKDGQARAKRVMREMLVFWKRNEKDERDHRKMAERQELENAKKAEAEREANRQKRKLNFLISQTELYSHFIGKKVKTDEIERSTDDVTAGVGASSETIKPGKPDAHTIDLPDSVAKLGTKVTNFDELDFDAEDDSALRQAAMVNAQHAIQEAQDRARAFDKNGKDAEPMSQFDEGEMNFQNPTSLQSMDIEQPSMLTCQLKEYQLKGLNWLVNLYEQGINGILADEMGLGKTVQSISVMAYLAEHHNIWGPFLVIAPASTLHNWQQEISRFVPTLKVLPYWGSAKDRKVLRKYWDRKHITYTKESPFHVLVTSYQLVVMDAPYFQKVRWQYMILDEAQAIKSSQSTRWKSLLSFHCRNRLLLTGTPIQNNMQELWALLHFIMPSLFDSHDEFSEWFSKDIESHAQSNTKLNEDQLKRLHMILKPFMLRRIKKHVQKELGDKIEEDVYCDLTYRQRAYYGNLRNKISILDLIEKAAVGDEQDTATLMNLVMQFRKVCNHPDLFERAAVTSPVSFSYWAETASFLREGSNLEVAYSVRNLVEFVVPRLIGRGGGRINVAGPDNELAGWRNHFLHDRLGMWTPENILRSVSGNGAFAWLRFVDASAGDVAWAARHGLFERAVQHSSTWATHELPRALRDESDKFTDTKSLFQIVKRSDSSPPLVAGTEGILHDLCNISQSAYANLGLDVIEPCARPAVSAPPIDFCCASRGTVLERQQTFFNKAVRQALYGISEKTELALLNARVSLATLPPHGLLPTPSSRKTRYTKIEIPSMRRFVTDSGKLAKLDTLLAKLKEGGHRVLLYFQMTRMIDLMEEYLTYRNYKYCRLDGSTKLEDRRDTVADFQSRSDIFVFLLSTRAGGLGINLTAADTVIFYDSDWNPTIDSQAMDRAHRLGQTRQVTVYRLITRGTIEERIRKRALQKEEVQRVVISGGAGAGTAIDFNTRSSRENRTKDIAMWLADDDQAAAIERKEAEIAEREAREPDKGAKGKRKAVAKRKIQEVSMDDIYHEGEGRFDDDGGGGAGGKPSGAATPTAAAATDDMAAAPGGAKRRKGVSKKAKSIREKLAIADGGA